MLKMISPDLAREIVLDNCQKMPLKTRQSTDAVGYAIAQDIFAVENHPAFNRAMMDGYAVRMCDSGAKIIVVGELFAGAETDRSVAAGECLEIMTGAPCPAWCEAVVPYEKAEKEGQFVSLPIIPKYLANIALAGKEKSIEDLLLSAGDEVSEIGVAALRSQGINEITIYPKPSVSFIATGAELSENSSQRGMIRDSNSPMIQALLADAGIEEIILLRAKDDRQKLRNGISEAMKSDVIILSGGVSMGKKDYVPEILEELGVELLFHKVTQKPGKPLLFGMYKEKPVFALPGNPLAVHNCFHRYIRPCLRKMSGLSHDYMKDVALLGCDLSVKGNRTVFQLSKVYSRDNLLFINPLKGKGSADVYSPVTANAYITIEVENQELRKGMQIEFEWTRSGQWQN